CAETSAQSLQIDGRVVIAGRSTHAAFPGHHARPRSVLPTARPPDRTRAGRCGRARPARPAAALETSEDKRSDAGRVAGGASAGTRGTGCDVGGERRTGMPDTARRAARGPGARAGQAAAEAGPTRPYLGR